MFDGAELDLLFFTEGGVRDIFFIELSHEDFGSDIFFGEVVFIEEDGS